jgi:predicted Zn-dependent protease
LLNKVTLACVHASVQTKKNKPADAITELQSAVPYDFSDPSKSVTIYYPGYAFLQMHSGKEAAAEFQKLLDNRGPTDFLYWSLANLGLARAFALTGDKDKSLAAYRQFLELWKDADPNIPILKQAKAECALNCCEGVFFLWFIAEVTVLLGALRFLGCRKDQDMPQPRIYHIGELKLHRAVTTPG